MVRPWIRYPRGSRTACMPAGSRRWRSNHRQPPQVAVALRAPNEQAAAAPSRCVAAESTPRTTRVGASGSASPIAQSAILGWPACLRDPVDGRLSAPAKPIGAAVRHRCSDGELRVRVGTVRDDARRSQRPAAVSGGSLRADGDDNQARGQHESRHLPAATPVAVARSNPAIRGRADCGKASSTSRIRADRARRRP